MKKIKSVISFFILLTFLCFIFNNQIQASENQTPQLSETYNRVSEEVIRKLDKVNNAENLFRVRLEDLPTLNEVFQLLESFLFNDEDALETMYSLDELDIIIKYLIKMARIGTPPEHREELEKDIEELFSDDDEEEENMQDNTYSYSLNYLDDHYYTVASSNSEDINKYIVLCSNPLKKITKTAKKVFKKAGHLVKKNRKTIAIISAVAVVGVTTYYIISSKSTENSYPFSNQDESIKTEKENNQTFNENVESIPYQDSLLANNLETEKPIITGILEDNIYSLKEELQIENNYNNPEINKNFWTTTKEAIKEHSAYATHKVLDEVTEYTKYVPGLIDEIGSFTNRFVPNEIFDNVKPEKGILESYEDNIYQAHQKIDQLFDTNQSEMYTKEAKEGSDKDWSIAILPPPSGILKESLDLEKLADAGKVFDRAGLTKAGRALAKHGGREGSVFPKPIGNPEQINKQGQEILEKILNKPNKKIILGNYERYGDVIDIQVPNLGGVRYSKEGEFIGFLEPGKIHE